MTELGFLVDLLLNHKLPKPTKAAVAARIKEVEERGLVGRPTIPTYAPNPTYVQTGPTAQAPSTMALLAKHPDLLEKVSASPVMPPIPESPPVAIVAQTPAAVAAINSRNAAINASLAGKVDKETGRPRKF